MKNLARAALAVLLCLLCGACSAAQEEGRTIVTSFYPMYVFTCNVAQDVPGVQVVNLTQEGAGCLHDYQLKTRDMAMLEGASALVINGGGMEPFMDRIAANNPGLPVIDAGAGIEMLCTEDHGHGDGGHDGHDHGVYNAHVWLDPALAVRQVENIAEGLAAVDSANAQAYRDNAAAYIARIEAMDAQMKAMLAPFAGREIVTFHESFVYFARAYGLEVADVISESAGEEPSTRQIAKICDLVKALGVRALIVEPQYPAKAAQTIARETGAQVYTLSPVVSGDGALDSYEQQMMENAQIMMGALSDGEN